MKEKYTEASIEIIYLKGMDVIVTSDGLENGGAGEGDQEDFGAMHG